MVMPERGYVAFEILSYELDDVLAKYESKTLCLPWGIANEYWLII